MPSPSAIVLMALAISSTWSSFFWEPKADQAVWFAWVVTALLLLVPAPKAHLFKQSLCYLPSLTPLALFIFTQPLFEGWSLAYTATLAASLCLYLAGHIAFHWKALISPTPAAFSGSSRLIEYGLSAGSAARVIAAVVWLTIYGSVFFLEMKTGFLNSSTPMVWLLNVVFVSLVFGFSILLLCPRLKQSLSHGLMETASSVFALVFLFSYGVAATGIASGSSKAFYLSQSETFIYLSVSPAFFAIALLLLAIARISASSPFPSHTNFRFVNESR